MIVRVWFDEDVGEGVDVAEEEGVAGRRVVIGIAATELATVIGGEEGVYLKGENQPSAKSRQPEPSEFHLLKALYQKPIKCDAIS